MKTWLLKKILEDAGALGLPRVDVKHAQNFLDHGEPGLCLEHIATQLHEHDIPISKEFFALVCEAAKAMQLPTDGYELLAGLVR